MVNNKIDYKKEYKELYQPKKKPSLINVPSMNFIMVNGKGDPQSDEYQNAMQILYSLSFTIKMSKMKNNQPKDYFEYVVPPLEGLWWSKEGKLNLNDRNNWQWTSMIRQPEFVTENFYKWALDEAETKKPELDFSKSKFLEFTEGDCVQIMHIGPYNEENYSMIKIEEFLDENELVNDSGNIRKHHEIYLSDPRRTKPENLRTVLRIPIRKK